jgi:hypothetical protein
MVADNAIAHESLAIPSAARLARSGQSVAGSLVAAVWSELVVDARGVRRELRQLHGTTNGDGWFAMCDLEAGDYQVRAELGKRATGFVDVAVRARDLSRTATAPPQFAGACGSIVVWTRT